MKLTYWVCRCKDDSECYNIRTRTKREATEIRGGNDSYTMPYKVTLEFKDSFELAEACLGEDRGMGLAVGKVPELSV